METTQNFRSIDELVRVLDREKVLLRDMFERRRAASGYRTDFALSVVDYKRERVQFLVEHGVIRASGDVLELEDVYLRFFEEVLDVNEEISVASVKELIDALRENIGYYLEETSEHRRAQYAATLRKTLRRIGLRTLHGVVKLKRSVDVAFKQEPNYKIKMARLRALDEKRRGIKLLMQECEKVMDGEAAFWQTAGADMLRTAMDVRGDFTEADHNLIEIERQIIDYLNQIAQQSAFCRKLRRLAYLMHHMTWREETNVEQLLQGKATPLWMETRPYNRFHLSLSMLQESEEAAAIIKKVAGRSLTRRLARTQADAIDPSLLRGETLEVTTVSATEIWRAFKAQSAHLFAFIQNYPYKQERTLAQHVTLFCQMATMHSDELRFTNQYATADGVEYAIVYAK